MSAGRWLRRLFVDPNFERKKAFLRSLELFRGLSSRELGQLAKALHGRTYSEGEVLFLEGDIGRALFILESGSVDLTRQGPDGPEKIYTLKAGEFFGEMALLEQLPRTASARATEKSQLYLLYRSKLDELENAFPSVAVCILGHLAQLLSARLRRAGVKTPKTHA
jgi:CRP/FNR family transcriptional regulator, cyclic AMP receptor protein